MRRLPFAVLAGAALLLSSCSDGRVRVYPVKGKVTVGGQPAADLFVYLHPVTPIVGAVDPMLPYAQTDKDGSFAISSFVSGDGAPAGEYVVTFEWLTYQRLSNQWGGPDKLKGKYSDAQKSTYRVTIEAKPTELPPYHLE